MTNTISVPRDTFERLAKTLDTIASQAAFSVADELRALLTAAPAVEGELEVIGFHCMDSAGIETLEWRGGSYADEPLCSLPKAQEIIEQQAARIAELQLDADRYRWIEANSTYGIDYRQRPELTLPIYAPDHREGLDAAIDKAIGEKHE